MCYACNSGLATLTSLMASRRSVLAGGTAAFALPSLARAAPQNAR